MVFWSKQQLSLMGRVLVASQVLLKAFWYSAAWPESSYARLEQSKYSRKELQLGKKRWGEEYGAKVMWNILNLTLEQGGLAFLDPQSEAFGLFAKFLERGFLPGQESKKILLSPWDLNVEHSDLTDSNWLMCWPRVAGSGSHLYWTISEAWTTQVIPLIPHWYGRACLTTPLQQRLKYGRDITTKQGFFD